VLRNQNRGVIRIFKDAIIGRECLEIHGINQVSRRSYTRTLDYTTSDWDVLPGHSDKCDINHEK